MNPTTKNNLQRGFDLAKVLIDEMEKDEVKHITRCEPYLEVDVSRDNEPERRVCISIKFPSTPMPWIEDVEK